MFDAVRVQYHEARAHPRCLLGRCGRHRGSGHTDVPTHQSRWLPLLESDRSQEHNAAFDALSDALKFGETVLSGRTMGCLIEDMEQLKNVVDILFDEPEHFWRVGALPLQQVADLGAARWSSPIGRKLAVRVGFQNILVVRPFVENLRENLSRTGAEVPPGVRIVRIKGKERPTPSVAKVLREPRQVLQDSGILSAFGYLCLFHNEGC